MLILTPTITLFAAITVVVVGSLILWSNPRRAVNRVVFSCSLHLALWLACLHLARTPGLDGLFWVRSACVVGASVPIHFWLVLHGALSTEHVASVGRFFRRNLVWVAVTLILTFLPTTYFFIPEDSTDAARRFGPGYDLYIGSVAALYGFLAVAAYIGSRRLSAGRRLELQVWLFGGCTMTTLILLLMLLNRIHPWNSDLVRIYQPVVVMVFYAGTAIAITTGRLFDGRQLFVMVLQKVVLVLCVAGVAYQLDAWIASLLIPDPARDPSELLKWGAWLATSAMALWFAGALNSALNRWLKVFPEATEARRAAFEAAKAELTLDGLEQVFLSVLRGWGKAEHVLVLSGPKDDIKGCGIRLPPNAPMVDTLRRIRWVTPERLARERADPEREDLRRFMHDHQLGVLVCSRGLTLTILVGVGVPISRRPYTFPQVQQLIELAEIMESALERAHFAMRAQQAERLATVGLLGAGVAHEIRNPLVTIKTFVQLLPQRHQEDGFRRKFFQLISEEITRIDRLTERLMELGSPRSYFMVAQPLHPLLRGTLELVEPKATDHGVDIATDLQATPDVIDTDAAAARQVLLNLCLNAVHAMQSSTGPRRLNLTTRNVPGGIEVCITDTGPGLASEMLPRLFTPFQSTKSTGFGLGLAISSEIMSGLKGTIAADPPAAGQGATFRLIFPCPSPSS
jgi:signal transduction histidine kinase